MKKILLSKTEDAELESGLSYALVDDKDFIWLSEWSWSYNYNGYACRSAWDGEKYRKLYMHRAINNTPDGFDTDHINRNKLDNRRINLRTLSRSLNNHNAPAPKNNSSGHKGVCWSEERQKWRSYITIDRKQVNLGRFKNKIEAINARKLAEENIC